MQKSRHCSDSVFDRLGIAGFQKSTAHKTLDILCLNIVGVRDPSRNQNDISALLIASALRASRNDKLGLLT